MPDIALIVAAVLWFISPGLLFLWMMSDRRRRDRRERAMVEHLHAEMRRMIAEAIRADRDEPGEPPAAVPAQ